MFCFCPDCIIDLSNLRIIEIPNYSFGESWFGLFVAIEHAAGMSLRFDGNLGGVFIWMLCFYLGGGGLWWCGGVENETAPGGSCLWRCVSLEKTLLKDYLRIPSSFLAMIAR